MIENEIAPMTCLVLGCICFLFSGKSALDSLKTPSMRQPLPSKAGRVLLVTNNRLSLPHPRPAGQLNLNRSRLKIPHHKTDASLQDSTICRYRICPLTEHLASLRILKQVADFTN